MQLEQIIANLYEERQYQLRRFGDRQSDGSFEERMRSVGDYLTYMRHYLMLADEAAASQTDADALDVLRKVVALGMACFEQHGVPRRDPNVPVFNAHDGHAA